MSQQQANFLSPNNLNNENQKNQKFISVHEEFFVPESPKKLHFTVGQLNYNPYG